MPLKVLVVDDATFIREILIERLRLRGVVHCWEAEDGEMALQMVAMHEPQLVFMDLVLPKMNGVEAIRQLRETNPDLCVIAMSTQDEETLIMNALAAGSDYFLTKPFEVNELDKIITQALTVESSNL